MSFYEVLVSKKNLIEYINFTISISNKYRVDFLRKCHKGLMTSSEHIIN